MLACCCKLDQSKLKRLSFCFFLATLFQGLSLLVFKSNVCEKGFFSAYFVNPNGNNDGSAYSDLIQSVSCGLSTGSKLAIAATVLWFVCNSMIPSVVRTGDGMTSSTFVSLFVYPSPHHHSQTMLRLPDTCCSFRLFLLLFGEVRNQKRLARCLLMAPPTKMGVCVCVVGSGSDVCECF